MYNFPVYWTPILKLNFLQRVTLIHSYLYYEKDISLWSDKKFDETAKQELFDALSKPWIQGLTFSGGNAIDSPYQIFLLAKEIRSKFPNKDIWLYSGYTYEQIAQSREKFEVLRYIDVLVDGPYIESQRDVTLAFRGSKNQRLIDVKQTLSSGEIVLYET